MAVNINHAIKITHVAKKLIINTDVQNVTALKTEHMGGVIRF